MTQAQTTLPPTRNAAACLLVATMLLCFVDAANAQRVASNLQSLYAFEEEKGNTVRDHSGTGKPPLLGVPRFGDQEG